MMSCHNACERAVNIFNYLLTTTTATTTYDVKNNDEDVTVQEPVIARPMIYKDGYDDCRS